MPTVSTTWGDSGPIIILNVTATDMGSYIDYSWKLTGKSRYNYGFSYSAPWVCSMPDGEYQGNFNIRQTSELAHGSGSISKTNYSQSLNFSAEVVSWGGMKWNNITGDQYDSCKKINYTLKVDPMKTANVPTIKYSSQILKTTGELIVSWSGATIGANSLRLTLTNQHGTSLVTIPSISISQSSYTFQLNNLKVHAGDTIYAQLSTNSNGEYVETSSSKEQVAKINTPPSRPQVSSNNGKNEIKGNETIVFTVSSGMDNDSQSLTNQYQINQNGWVNFSGNTVTISANSPGVKKGEINYIYFKTVDPLEESESTVLSFSVVGKPDFNYIPTIKYTTIKAETGANLVKDCTISFSLSTGQNAPKIKVLYITSNDLILDNDSIYAYPLQENYYIYNTSYNTKEVTIDISKLPSDVIGYGQYFNFKIRVSGDTDGEEDATYSSWLGQARRPFLPRLPEEETVILQSDIIGNSSYFKEQFTVSATVLSDDLGYAPYEAFQAVARRNKDSYTVTKDFNTGIFSKQTLTFSEGIKQTPPGELIYIDIKVKDKAGQERQMTLSKTIQKASDLTFLKDTITFNPTLIRPLSTDSLQVGGDDTFTAVFAPAKSVGGSDVTYFFSIRIPMEEAGNHEYQLQNTQYTKDYQLTQDSIQNINTLVISGSTIRSILKDKITNSEAQRNRYYPKAELSIKAQDNLGNISTIIGRFQVEFREKPQWPSSTGIQIYHSYDISGTEVKKEGPIPTYLNTAGEQNLDLRMYNAKETAVFSIPKPVDPNNDLAGIRIYLSVNDFTEITEVLSGEVANYEATPWQEVAIDSLEKDSTGNYLYAHDIPTYEVNKYLYFKFVAFDSQGNESESKNSNTFLISCRTVAPAFSTGDVKFERVGDTTININYNIKITDLGGSATKEGWSEDYYNKYPNFERSIPNKQYTPKVTLIVEIDTDPKFNTNNHQISKHSQTFPVNGLKKMLDFSATTTTFTNFIKTEKFYARFTLIVSYGINSLEENQAYTGLAVLQSFPQITSYFGNVPTIAYREHAIGINTSTLEPNEIFSVGAHSGKNMIVFRGATSEVTLDTNTGILDGAIISGGSW